MKHRKVKVRVIKDIIESSNSREYHVDEELNVREVKKESEYYQIIFDDDIDMIPKDCVKIIKNKKEK